MHKPILFITLFLFQIAFAQKIQQQQMSSDGIDEVQILGDGFSAIEIVATNEANISIKTKIDGEYFKQIALSTEIKDNSLRIANKTAPFFVPPNDKLAAHKVMSVSLQVHLPERMFISCYAKQANVKITGTFTQVYVSQEEGNCFLDKVSKAEVQTKRADVILVNIPSQQVHCYSKYGTVMGCEKKTKKASINIETVYGSISLKETE